MVQIHPRQTECMAIGLAQFVGGHARPHCGLPPAAVDCDCFRFSFEFASAGPGFAPRPAVLFSGSGGPAHNSARWRIERSTAARVRRRSGFVMASSRSPRLTLRTSIDHSLRRCRAVFVQCVQLPCVPSDSQCAEFIDFFACASALGSIAESREVHTATFGGIRLPCSLVANEVSRYARA
jgi:hypothetical protein